MSLCGVCFLWDNGECLEFEHECNFDDDVDCIMFDLSPKARKILLRYKEELIKTHNKSEDDNNWDV